MPKFRKKPVVIEAFQMTSEAMGERVEWPEWLHAAFSKGRNEEGSLSEYELVGGKIKRMVIVTLEGEHQVIPDDWIIQGIQGEIYPCKPDIFDATYEAVAGNAS